MQQRFRLLASNELNEVINLGQREKLCIGVATSAATGTIKVLMGDGRIYEVPYSWFTPNSPDSPFRPDFTNVFPTDYGATIALGNYEASVDYVLDRYDKQHPPADVLREHIIAQIESLTQTKDYYKIALKNLDLASLNALNTLLMDLAKIIQKV